MFSEKVKEGFVDGKTSGEAGRCGWVCRKLKQVGGILTSFGIVPIGPALMAIGNAVGVAEDIFGKIELPDNLSASEEAILETWDSNKFLPYLKVLATQHQNALAQTTIESRVNASNAVLLKMAVIQQHYKTNETQGLSIDAQHARGQYIEQTFAAMRKLIDEKLIGSGFNKLTVSYEVSSAISEYSSLFQTSNLTKVNTTKFSKITPSFETVEPLPSGNVPVPNVLPAGVGTTEITNGSNEATATNQTFLQKNGVWLLLGCVAAWALSGNKKKSKSK